jgi:hypothetical protein
MSLGVTDYRSNPNDQIAHAVRVIRKSKHRQRVFSAIYEGKKLEKAASYLVKATGLPRIRILQEAGVLSGNGIVIKTKVRTAKGVETGYRKDPFFSQHKDKILSLAISKSKFEKFPTKITPRVAGGIIKVSYPRRMVNTHRITIDDIDSFSRVKTSIAKKEPSRPVYENRVKKGIMKILGQKGHFDDWGGETTDLESWVKIQGKRLAASFALKGKATSGKLVPGKMGKNGDQIQRLFRSSADVFLVQYWGQVDGSVAEQMEKIAIAKSVADNKRIYWGIIDGADTKRLISAYAKYF